MDFQECQDGFCLDCPGFRTHHESGDWDSDYKEYFYSVSSTTCTHECHAM